MATDTSGAIEPATPDAAEEAYISPAADFVIVLGVACLVALAGVALILP